MIKQTSTRSAASSRNVLSLVDGQAQLMKNSSAAVAQHQNKAFALAEIAKEECKIVQQMNDEYLKKEDNLNKINKKVVEISNNFEQLEIFHGRFLKHIYKH